MFSKISFFSLVIACISFLFVGCFELEQTMEISSKGKIIVNFDYIIPANSLKIWGELQPALQGNGASNNIILDGKKIRQYYRDNDCKLTSYHKKINKDSQGNVVSNRITFTVEAKDYQKALLSGVFGNFNVETKGDNIVVKPVFLALPTKDLEKKKSQIKNLCQGMKLSLTIKAPGKVINTKGENLGNGARWQFDVDKNIDFLDDLPNMQMEFPKI